MLLVVNMEEAASCCRLAVVETNIPKKCAGHLKKSNWKNGSEVQLYKFRLVWLSVWCNSSWYDRQMLQSSLQGGTWNQKNTGRWCDPQSHKLMVVLISYWSRWLQWVLDQRCLTWRISSSSLLDAAVFIHMHFLAQSVYLLFLQIPCHVWVLQHMGRCIYSRYLLFFLSLLHWK